MRAWLKALNRRKRHAAVMQQAQSASGLTADVLPAFYKRVEGPVQRRVHLHFTPSLLRGTGSLPVRTGGRCCCSRALRRKHSWSTAWHGTARHGTARQTSGSRSPRNPDIDGCCSTNFVEVYHPTLRRGTEWVLTGVPPDPARTREAAACRLASGDGNKQQLWTPGLVPRRCNPSIRPHS